LGSKVGTQFTTNIRKYLSVSETLQTLIPIVNTTIGRQIFDGFVTASKAAYPQYYEELQGVADGAKVNLEYLLMLSLQLEIQVAYQESETTPLACSDIHLNSPELTIFGHNEDFSAGVKEYAYILDVLLTPHGGKPEVYTAYTYPGLLSGNAFGWNPHGVAFSCNAVVPTNIIKGGIGRAFINRDMVLSESVADGIARATAPGRALGFSFNIGSKNPKTIVNVEVAPTSYAVTDVVGNFSHFNMYKVLEVPQQPDPSTFHRQARADQIPAPQSATDILRILGDNKDTQWPIYRNGAPPDTGSVTVATALFDLDRHRVSIWTDNPKLNPSPLYVIPM